jgi:hypothetical protein
MPIIWEHEIFYVYYLGDGGILCSLHDFQRDLCSLDTIVIGFIGFSEWIQMTSHESFMSENKPNK